MYLKKPIYKKVYKKFIYAFTKILIRNIDRVLNLTLEAKIKTKLLKLHSQNYQNLKNKIYFIHVPKCGGTTVHSILQKIYKKKLFNYNHPYKYDENTHYPLKKKESFLKLYFITVLRHPCYRVWSFYHDCLRDEKSPYHQVATKGLENFCKKVWEVQNMYTKYFSGNMTKSTKEDVQIAIQNLKKFKNIFIFENLDTDLKYFLKKIKKRTKIITRNTKKYQLPNSEEIKTIKSYNEFDIKIFKKILIIKKKEKLLKKFH